jgi:hypothetical protein
MTLLCVAYIGLCLGFCLGVATSAVLVMHRRSDEDAALRDGGYQPRRAGDGPINPPPRNP